MKRHLWLIRHHPHYWLARELPILLHLERALYKRGNCMSNALPIPSEYSQDFMEGAVKFVELLRTAAVYPNLISWGMRQRGDWDNPDQREASLARAQQVLFDLVQVAEYAREQFLYMKSVADPQPRRKALEEAAATRKHVVQHGQIGFNYRPTPPSGPAPTWEELQEAQKEG